MKKQHLWFGSFVFLMLAVFLMGSRAYAESARQFNSQLRLLERHRAIMEARLGLVDEYPHAGSYFDDLEDHYEHVLIVKDQIDQEMR